jgi:hypothetical protein
MRQKLVIFFVTVVCGLGCTQVDVEPLEFNRIDTSEADSIRTLKSLQKIDDLFMMTYYGDYDLLLDETNERIIKDGTQAVKRLEGEGRGCSMFAALGDLPLYGRNFDNPDCGVLVSMYRPSDGFASVGFSRMNDFGFDENEDPTSLPLNKRELLLNAPFFTPDGMNECGVAVALAALRSTRICLAKNKKSLFITCLVREILDHARNIDESVSIIKKYNVFDNDINTVSHHLLISDASGRSAIVEYSEDEWRVMSNEEPWQVIANSPLYNISEESRKSDCWRYKILYEKLEKVNGNITWEEGMELLESVSVKGTQWSTICDLKRREIYISLYRDFNRIKKIKLKYGETK